MSLPKIVYTASGATSTTTLQFVRGPVDFQCYYSADSQIHDNLSTSGAVRERVVEHEAMLISFEMPNMIVGDDLGSWSAFMATALLGSSFAFYPNAALTDYYNCVSEDTGWQPKCNAPKKYAATVAFRILQDSQAPANPAVVIGKFYGV